jgi:hypothetical protein
MKKLAFDKTPEFAHFRDVMKRLIAVPKAELDEQVRLHAEESRKDPNRRGPKPKAVKRPSARRSNRT